MSSPASAPAQVSAADQVRAAADAVRSRWTAQPRVGVILGSGLGGLARWIESPTTIPYAEVPHFPRSTAPGHRGALVCGRLAGVDTVAMEGRFHLYEGYSAAEVTFPVRVMAELGVQWLIVSNACGAMNPAYQPGDIMIVTDHVNQTWANPLVGPRCEAGGLECPDMSQPYDRELIDCARRIARAQHFTAHRGVYVGVTGPNYETRAEYRYFRRLGGDVVGMSTVCEAIVAAQCGLRVLALSVVTNVSLPDRLQPTTAEGVISIAASAEPKLRAIALGVIEHCCQKTCSLQ